MKLIPIYPDDYLAQYCKRHCPPSFVYHRHGDGYGYVDYLSLPRGRWQIFATKIAEIDETSITVFHPEYLSDITDLVQRYETETGKEVVVRYFNEAS